MYTHFMFTSLGKRAIAYIDGEPAVKGKWYEADKPVTFRKKNDDDFGKPYDFFRYKLKKDNVESNESVITVNFPVNLEERPYFNGNLSFDIVKSEKKYLSEKLVRKNRSFDRIRFKNIESSGHLFIGDSIIKNNKIYMAYDIESMYYITNNGVGSQYETISFQVGNGEEWSQEYNMVFNLKELKTQASKKERVNIDNESISDDTDAYFKFTKDEFEIINLPSKSTLKLRVTVNLGSNFNVEADESNNQVYVSYDGEIHNITENGTYEYNVNTDWGQDKTILLSSSLIKKESQGYSVNGNLIFELVDINGDESKINQNKKRFEISIN